MPKKSRIRECAICGKAIDRGACGGQWGLLRIEDDRANDQDQYETRRRYFCGDCVSGLEYYIAERRQQHQGIDADAQADLVEAEHTSFTEKEEAEAEGRTKEDEYDPHLEEDLANRAWDKEREEDSPEHSALMAEREDNAGLITVFRGHRIDGPRADY